MTIEILQRQDDRGDVPHVTLTSGGGRKEVARLLARALSGEAAQSIAAGDLVRVREGVWRVMEVRTFAPPASVRTRTLKLIGADALNRWQPCTLLEPFDQPRRVEAAQAPRVVSRARWMRTCAALIAASPPSECPATIADAQVTLMPHQIDPVLAVLRGRASRLLLADAVGLGKTIQAALLVRELRARGCADRVLILTPSGLREQWRQELWHRTGLRADIIDAASLAARTRDVPPDVNPWSLPGISIVSLDFIKQPSVLRGASTIVWDILIADEAHNLNEGTGRLAAVNLLARHSRHVVLLTATPHHGSDDAFATLCGIGRSSNTAAAARVTATTSASECDVDAEADAEADPIAIFRRTRQTMGMARTRKVHVLRVMPTRQERRLHTLLARYVRRVECECGGGGADADGAITASLAMSILLKRASSSAWSLERSLRRRLALLDDRALTASDDQPETQPPLPFGDDDHTDHDDHGDRADDVADGEPAHVLGAPGLRSMRIERAWLTLLIEASRNASRAESKPHALARLLRRCREPALIYTEYRDTLTHLVRTLPDASSSSHALLHGGLGADDRRTALARFASGDARILLTTDAAGEGLNLHHRCRLVINVELPWNPNRLEQRIGRVDRLGQTRTVHAIHLVAVGTAEEPMLTRLTTRITRIAATLGDAPSVLRGAHEFASPSADMVRERDSLTSATLADATAVLRSSRESGSPSPDMTRDVDTLAAAFLPDTPVAARVASEFVSSDADTAEVGVPNPVDASRGVHRCVSTEAASAAAQLQLLRSMRSRAWRISRRRADGTHASRGDPLLTLDERAPLIAVTRRHRRLSDACELPSPGLICIWRTRVERDNAQAQAQAHAQGRADHSPFVLTVMHIACEVPRLTTHRAVAAFVTSTLERCRARVQRLLDDELTRARERDYATERARIERLARRDDAIEAEITAMLRDRAAADGMFQPLLFDDIAVERSTRASANDDGGRTWASDRRGRAVAGMAAVHCDVRPGSEADADADGGADAVAAARDMVPRPASAPAMVLVLR